MHCSASVAKPEIFPTSRNLKDLPGVFRVLLREHNPKGNSKMRKVMLGAATALAFASPALAADFSERSSYEREVHTYEQREARPVVVEHWAARPVVVEERAPVVSETVVVRRPV